ncbi:dihydrofolate reductase family protein [Amycolatopsis sp. WQ 127309]|uniref:dihydrofolate reductase family protein n=1 Tax=Amycolatopsis sp. WQ 127309 TaxID=2932773 RepID=UPI001FF5AFA4|nr:dihydrofolate reductase family protein [Amycolatopsis sp. WQ 127309]UOZ11138.1 dihydrofolate reductase family protein [Amycolatopsis sp. WQ 127309]
MGRIVNATYMTLDGDITNMQNWHFTYLGEQAHAAVKAQLAASDALIMGRKTYDGFSQAWPQLPKDEVSDRMNSIDKYVVSTTLKDPEWTGSKVLSENVVDEIRALKERTAGDILQYGFGDVTRLLLDNGLLDELRVWLHPVLSGNATPDQLLYRETGQKAFTLNGTEVHDTGMIILSYTPAQ